MKIHYTDVLDRMDALDRSLSILTTQAETIKNHVIPNHKLEVITDKLVAMNKILDELYDIFGTY